MNNARQQAEQKRTELFNKTGSFFAFGTEQFNKAKKDGIKYASFGAGLICPVENVKELAKGLNTIAEEQKKQDLKENGLNKIILRELYNYEAFYTYEIEDTLEALKEYGVTAEQVQKVFNKEVKRNGHNH